MPSQRARDITHIARVAYRPKEACKALGISMATLYRRMEAGDLRTVRFGGARLIAVAEIERVLAGCRSADKRQQQEAADDHSRPSGSVLDVIERMEADIAADRGRRKG